MKGFIIEEIGYASVLDYTHGLGKIFHRIVVPEADNLSITLSNGEIYVFTGFHLNKAAKIIKEIEVPNELVNKALSFKKARDDFFKSRASFEKLFIS